MQKSLAILEDLERDKIVDQMRDKRAKMHLGVLDSPAVEEPQASRPRITKYMKKKLAPTFKDFKLTQGGQQTGSASMSFQSLMSRYSPYR